jgi:hypothetical protein
MSRTRTPGDAPLCWCGAAATFGGRCTAHAGTDTGKPIDPPRPSFSCKCGHTFAEHCGPSRAVECSVIGCACQGFDDGMRCGDLLRPSMLPAKVERWLQRHDGARLVVSSDSVELCCRELRSELTTDSSRYVSRENVSAAQREAVLSEMVDEMAIWEANGWEYES